MRLAVVDPASVTIKIFILRYGTSIAKGELVISWKVIPALNWLVDYVVTREPHHWILHDQPLEFWRELARVMPDY